MLSLDPGSPLSVTVAWSARFEPTPNGCSGSVMSVRFALDRKSASPKQVGARDGSRAEVKREPGCYRPPRER